MDQSEATNPRLSPKSAHAFWATVFFILSGIVLISSIILALRISHTTDKKNRDLLLTRVQTVAHLTNAGDIEKLSGDWSNVEKPEYQKLKESMKRIREINKDSRFVYLMGSNGSKLFFYVDSEDPESEGYSPPGEVYEDTTSLQFTNYYDGISFTEGPYQDSWGSWVSAYAPIYDESGAIIAITGMDVNAQDWQASLRFIIATIILIGVLLAKAFILAGLYLRRSSMLLSLFETSNKRLELERENLKGMLSQAHIAEWTLNPKSREMSFDNEMYALTGIIDGTRVTQDLFEGVMSEHSRAQFRHILEVAIDHREAECSLSVAITNNTIERTVKLVLQIEYGTGDSPILIKGTAQDMSA